MQMLTLYRQLFSRLEQQAAEYAVWKNSQELPEALSGSGDIDLYVYPGSRVKFLAVLQEIQFVCLKSHKAFPCVEHYYGYDKVSGKFAHLHCYFRMVTGESHIKQYVVPIEPYLAAYPAVTDAQGIRILHPVLQKKLNIFRRKIKLSCLPGALLFFRERRGYRLERQMTSDALQDLKVGPVANSAVNAGGWLDEIQESPSIGHEVLDGLRYRFRYQQWNRFNPFATPIYRYSVILLRLHGKLLKRKKLFPVGLMIAVTSTGRENMNRQIDALFHQWMGKHFSVHTLRYRQSGSADTHLMSSLKATPHHSDTKARQADLSLYQAVRLAWDSRRWRDDVRRSVRLCTAGSIVIWNPSEVRELRQALDVGICANSEATRIMQVLLRMSQSYLKFEPISDIRFLVTSTQAAKPAISNSMTDNNRRSDVAASASCGSFRESERTNDSSDHAIVVESSDEMTIENSTPFKTALWGPVAQRQ